MSTEIQTVKSEMTLKNWAEEIAECQSPMQTIGKEYVHEELVYVPAKIFRRKHYVEVVKCPVCGEYTEKSINDKTVIIKGKAPETVCRKVIAHRSFLPISSMRSMPKPYRLKGCQKTSEA